MFESLASCFAAYKPSFVGLSKSMRVETTVGTPRCGVRSAQRADPTIRARQAICVIPAIKNHANVLGKPELGGRILRKKFSRLREPKCYSWKNVRSRCRKLAVY